jgi:hypothetical protein
MNPPSPSSVPYPLALLGLALLAGCAASRPAIPAMVGADADAHGCRASAGYRWCAQTRACERPWELAARVGLANEASVVDGYCAATPR